MSCRTHRFWMIALAFLTAQASACGYSPFEQPGSLEISGEPEGAKVVVTGPNGFRDERGLPWISGGGAKWDLPCEGFPTGICIPGERSECFTWNDGPVGGREA